MTRLAAVLLALAVLGGCAGRAQQQRAIVRGHVVLDIASGVLIEVHQQYLERFAADRAACDGPCLRRYVAVKRALDGTRHTILAARHVLGAADAERDERIATALSCAVAAVGRLLSVAELVDARPSGGTLDAWSRYASSIGGALCVMSADPNASTIDGEAGGG